MVAGWFAGAEIVTAMAILIASWPAAIAAALIGETALSLQYGWATVSHWVAALCLGAWAAIALLYSPCPDRPAAGSTGDRTALFWPEMASCALAGLLWGAFNAGLVIFYSFTPQLLAQRGWPPVVAGSATSLGLWVTVVSLPLGGWVVEVLGRPSAGIIASCIAAAAVLSALPIVPWPVALGFSLGLAIGPGAGAIVGLPARMASPNNRPVGFGVFYTAYYGVMAVGPALAGSAQNSWNRVDVPLLTGSVFFLAGVPLLATATAVCLISGRPDTAVRPTVRQRVSG
jgi:MFS family permease